jgi:ABC-type transporter Mla MlaB component
VAFSIFGKKDEPEKKNDPAAKKEPVAGKSAGPATVSPAAAKPPPGKAAVTPPKPASTAAKAPAAMESIPVKEEDDLDFTSLLGSTPAKVAGTPEAPAAAPKTAAPAPPPPPLANAPAPQAKAPAAAPAAKASPTAAPAGKAPPAAPAAGPPPAAPGAKPPPAATSSSSPQAKAAAPTAGDLGSIDPGALGGGAKSGSATFEKTWMPEGRALAPEKQAAPKPLAQQAAPPARPRGTASAGPTAPPLAAAAPKPASAVVAPAAPPPVAGAAAKSVVSAAIPVASPVASPVAGPDTRRAENPPIEVSAPEIALPPAIEQAAVLFANGQAEAAVNALKGVIAANDLREAASQAWLMLFDLYQLQGRKDEQEALALEFVVKFERSATVWRDEPKQAKDPALQTGAGAYFALTGELSAASALEIAQLAKLAEKNPILRIEFGNLKGVDAAGAQLLLDTLKGFGKSNRGLILSNHTTLVDLLAGKAEVGRKEEPQVYWMLLLELFQVLGLQIEFDDAALNFAITYELSPPSFEERAKPAKAEMPSAMDEVGEHGFVMSGEICGSDDGQFAALVKYAANRDDVVIDMGRAKRVDFVAAGAMLNAITGLAGSGKTVQIRSANELIGALFQVVGISRLARLVKRR